RRRVRGVVSRCMRLRRMIRPTIRRRTTGARGAQCCLRRAARTTNRERSGTWTSRAVPLHLPPIHRGSSEQHDPENHRRRVAREEQRDPCDERRPMVRLVAPLLVHRSALLLVQRILARIEVFVTWLIAP